MSESHLSLNITHDNVTLMEVLKLFWDNKWAVLIITSICLAVGIVYTSTSKMMYESSVFIQPPTRGDVAAFNYRGIDGKHLIKYRQMDVYDIFQNKLAEQSIKNEFLSTNPSQLFVRKEQGVGLIQLPRYIISVRASESDKSAIYLKKFINLVDNSALKELQSNIDSERSAFVDNLQEQINLSPSDNSSIQLKAKKQLTFINNMKVSLKNGALFRLDGEIMTSTKPVSSRKMLIIILFVMFGLVLSIGVIIFQNAFKNFNVNQ